MAPDTKAIQDKDSATNDAAAAGEPRDEKEIVRPDYQAPAKAEPKRHGFFTLYKSGQGYWTRLGTAIGAALLILLTGWNLYRAIPVVLQVEDQDRERLIAAIVAGVFTVGLSILAWRLINKPANVDFLIATDSEMKKVNWTSRKDLIGSTKVVILFMFMIAAFLFIVDIIFGYFFWAINVLQSSPFGEGGTIGGG